MTRMYWKIAAFSVLAFFCSCSDDDNAKVKSSFKFEGKTYKINQVDLVDDGEATGDDGTVYRTNLTFIRDRFNDHYDMLALSLYTSEGDLALPDGTYTFSPDIVAPGLWSGDLLINTDLALEGDRYIVESGSITIKLVGEHHEIGFNLTMDNGEKVTGKFRGFLGSVE